MADGTATPVLSDMDGKAHGAYGLEGRPELVWVRPDGHNAFRGEADRADRLAAYCRKVFGALSDAEPLAMPVEAALVP